MSPFSIQITKGCLSGDIEHQDKNAFQALQDLNALEESDGRWKLHSLYRAGRLYISNDGKGYVEAEFKEQRDLVVEAEYLNDAKHGDVVVVKRLIARRGRASGKVITIIAKAHLFNIAYTHKDIQGNFSILNIRTGEALHAIMEGMDLKAFKLGTVLKVDVDDDKVLEILGHLDDAKVDEKISLALYNRENTFPEICVQDALKVEKSVNSEEHPERIDLTHLDFCTIDPITAKDFDDAIYFDIEAYTLYVAIADVSHYVPYFTDIDKEAKKRGFTTYLPHKSFPMLPRELSENICSLKPHVDRLAFVAKIILDKKTLKPLKETFFEAIIHSKHRFNYEDIDKIIHNNTKEHSDEVKKILTYLLPLYEITKQLRKSRLKYGFDFRSEETTLSIDAKHLLKATQIETGTPSHSLIEECMLLANQASAKRFEGDTQSIFRIHEPPQLSRIEKLLTELSSIGLFVTEYEDSPSLIRAIQKEANRMNVASEVDAMVIKSLRQASYGVENVGHFGLGFSHYSHFTSPIRRYSDLILHRLIKTQLKDEEKEASYLLRNIEPLCARVSELEREATKAEWDFRDRKFARWAKEHIDETFEADIIEAGENAKALLLGEVKGISVNMHGDNVMLFDRITLKISEVNIAQATIMAVFVEKLTKDEMEL